jgi:hypothetical protein
MLSISYLLRTWQVSIGMSFDLLDWQKEGLKMKRTFSEWVLIVLIISFFLIPICSLTVTDRVTCWPQGVSSFVFNLILR